MLSSLNRHRSIAIGAVCVAALVSVAGFLLPLSQYAQGSSPQPEIKTFDIASDPDFKDYKQVVTQFAEKHQPKSENKFCIIGLSGDNAKVAWVLWREGAEIILWEGGSNLDNSRRIIHLKSDVVPTEADLHGSTYLVTKAWVEDLSKTCERSGVTVRVDKTKSSKSDKLP